MRLHPAAAATYQQVKFTLTHRAVDLVTGAGDYFGVNPACISVDCTAIAMLRNG